MKMNSMMSPSLTTLILLLLSLLSFSSALSTSSTSSVPPTPSRPSYINGSFKDDVDNRPHEQRVTGPRKARRLNHSFQHLYRHDGKQFDDRCLASGSLVLTKPEVYLKEYGGFTSDEIEELSRNFPPLLELDVKRHIVPKMRFLKYTLMGRYADEDGGNKQNILSDLAKKVPPQFYGARLERTVAPMHAFLIHAELPHGQDLLQDDAKLMKEFLISCRHTKSFCAMCNTWRRRYGHTYRDKDYAALCKLEDDNTVHDEANSINALEITPAAVKSFNAIFQRGLMSASRNNMDPTNQHAKNIQIRPDQVIHLLIRSGSNPLERDVRDISLLHWAAGSGNLLALKELIRSFPGGFEEAIKIEAKRDGASILHWAAAGADAKDFGSGGHLHVCNFLMDHCGSDTKKRKAMVNALTKDGNSVLMWAAWSGSFDIVKLLVRQRADSLVQNRNGCTVAHWAASGGSLDVCKYLHDTIGLDFSPENYAGNTPLSHAVAYGRTEIIKWLRDELSVKDLDEKAFKLALDFTMWEDESSERKKVFNLFNEEVL